VSVPIPEPVVWQDADEARDYRRLWATIMLTGDLEVCRSILLGRPVLARQLDAQALRRALRGEQPPEPDSYFRVRVGHLDAVAEGGAFTPSAGRRDARRQPVACPGARDGSGAA
jgi:hypothetical protein